MRQPIMHIVEDNILNAKERLVAHCCNTKNTMGAGVALALRTRFPEVYKADCDAHKCIEDLLGTTIVVPVTTRIAETEIHFIANMYAQPTYGRTGRHVDYEALYKCLEGLRRQCEGYGVTAIGLPYKFASDRAGGDWRIVQAMIDGAFADSNIRITLYELNIEPQTTDA